MFFGNINQLGIEKIYPAPIRKALEYLKANDFTSMQTGVYEIDGKNIFAQVMEAQTDTVDRKNLKSIVNTWTCNTLRGEMKRLGWRWIAEKHRSGKLIRGTGYSIL